MPCGDFSLSNQIAVVTGAGSGINLAFAKLAAAQGARVIIADLRLTNDAQKFVNESSGGIVFAKCDVSKRADLENLIKVSLDNYGDVPDVYVAGAGVFEPDWSNWWDDTEGDRYAEIDINVNHPLKLARIAMRALLSRNKRGVILITASLAGYTGTFAAPLYSASKHALVGFVRSMGELDRLQNIKVVDVAPGMVQTPLWTDRPETMRQFGYDPDTAVLPDAVAQAMLEITMNGKYGGGTSLEVSMAGIRELGVWNIDPPKASGTALPQEAVDRSYAPLIAIMNKERKRN